MKIVQHNVDEVVDEEMPYNKVPLFEHYTN
jgi:hypothetical protein